VGISASRKDAIIWAKNPLLAWWCHCLYFLIRPWDPSSLQYNLAAGRFYCKGYSELTLTYTRIKNALRKFVFALIDFSKFEDLNCFAPCDRSPNLSATNFPPNFGQICTARYPMISEFPQKKNAGCRICRNCTTSERNLCQRYPNTRNSIFLILVRSTVARKTTLKGHRPLANID